MEDWAGRGRNGIVRGVETEGCIANQRRLKAEAAEPRGNVTGVAARNRRDSAAVYVHLRCRYGNGCFSL